MHIQEISTSNNHKKMLLKAIKDEAVMFEDDNGDVVVNVAAYAILKKGMSPAPIEEIVGKDRLNFDAEYFVFS